MFKSIVLVVSAVVGLAYAQGSVPSCESTIEDPQASMLWDGSANATQAQLHASSYLHNAMATLNVRRAASACLSPEVPYFITESFNNEDARTVSKKAQQSISTRSPHRLV